MSEKTEKENHRSIREEMQEQKMVVQIIVNAQGRLEINTNKMFAENEGMHWRTIIHILYDALDTIKKNDIIENVKKQFIPSPGGKILNLRRKN